MRTSDEVADWLLHKAREYPSGFPVELLEELAQDYRDTFGADDDPQDIELQRRAQYTFICYPCGTLFKTSSQELMSKSAALHRTCTFQEPSYPASKAEF